MKSQSSLALIRDSARKYANRLPSWFILSAGGILLSAAFVRFLIVAGNSRVLSLPEPMLGIPLRYAVLIVGGLELIVALICLFGKRIGLQIGLLAWMVTNYVVFHIALVWMHYRPQASCIGSLTDPLQLSGGTTGLIVRSIPAYLLLGSLATLVWLWFQRKATIEAGFMKMSCPSCKGHIKFAVQNVGQQIPCPHCKTTLTLRKPENLKMSCFFCKEHIEFPVHAIGEKLKCPHCNMDITLQQSI